MFYNFTACTITKVLRYLLISNKNPRNFLIQSLKYDENTYSQCAVPNAFLTHLVLCSQGLGEHETIPTKKIKLKYHKKNNTAVCLQKM